MDSITLGDLSGAIMFLVGLIGGITALLVYAKKGFNKLASESHTALEQRIMDANHNLEHKIDNIAKELDQTQKDNAKNFITNFLAEVDRGRKYSQAELECFCENLRVYEAKDGDGFVHSEISRLQSDGKLPKFN